MVQYVLQLADVAGRIAFVPPADSGAREAIKRELRKCRDKHHDYVLLTLQPPKRPRTTGPGSQNNHVWGHATQIATETGNEVDDVMDAAKERALKRGYPYHVNKLTGKVKPYGTEELDTEQCGMLIDELHMIAGEMGITLIEAD